MPLILNIDTSSYYCSVALSNNEKIITHSEKDSRHHTQVLLTLIKELLNNSGYTIKDLYAIAVNIGPGSYTGLRVGLATAKGLCYSSALPLIPVNGLTALAKEAVKQNKNRSGAYLVLQDNYRSGWYCAAYDENLNCIIPPSSSTNIDDIISNIPHHPVFVCGDTPDDKNNIIFLPGVSPIAEHLAPIAASLISDGSRFDISILQPLYINSIFSS